MSKEFYQKNKERRKTPPKRLKKRERRADMKIITSASEGDIYAWALSLVVMAAILVGVTVLATLKG